MQENDGNGGGPAGHHDSPEIVERKIPHKRESPKLPLFCVRRALASPFSMLTKVKKIRTKKGIN